MLLRSLSAVSQSLASNPMIAALCAFLAAARLAAITEPGGCDTPPYFAYPLPCPLLHPPAGLFCTPFLFTYLATIAQ